MSQREYKNAAKGYVQFLMDAGFSKSELRKISKMSPQEGWEKIRKRLRNVRGR